MIFNEHSNLVGKHAFLSASKYHWTNYDDDKLERTYASSLAAQRGSDLHAFAHEAIRLGIRLPRSQKTLNLYVNDAVGFRMNPEQVLYYSDNAFGTADAVSFRHDRLRIHDLKTGELPGSMRQLEIYTAFFCLEYGYKPFEFKTELRIYQYDEIHFYEPDPNDIKKLMDKIVIFDKRISDIKNETLRRFT